MSDGVSCCIGPDGLHPCLRFLQHLHQLLFSGSFLGNVHVLPSLQDKHNTDVSHQCTHRGECARTPISVRQTQHRRVTSTHTHRTECAWTPISVRQTQHRCVTLTHTEDCNSGSFLGNGHVLSYSHLCETNTTQMCCTHECVCVSMRTCE